MGTITGNELEELNSSAFTEPSQKSDNEILIAYSGRLILAIAYERTWSWTILVMTVYAEVTSVGLGTLIAELFNLQDGSLEVFAFSEGIGPGGVN